jgi:hypothetical protein
LIEDTQAAGFRLFKKVAENRDKFAANLKALDVLDGDVPTAWEILVHVHGVIRSVINGLLAGLDILIGPLSRFDRSVLKLDRKTWIVRRWFKEESIRDELIAEFIPIIQQSSFPFPFRRCPVCFVVFVPGKNQKYCTPTCTAKGTEAARKDARKEYMRGYMAKRRKKAKQPTQKAK